MNRTKKDVHDPDNHDGVITHLEPDILECKDKWALGSMTINKACGGDGIPVELFQILKDDAVKVLHSICQQIWKTQQWPQDWKRSVFILIPKKGNAKECFLRKAKSYAFTAVLLLLPVQNWFFPMLPCGLACPLLLEYVSCESSFSGISLSVSSLSHLHHLKSHRYKWDSLNYVLGFLFDSDSNERACNGGDLSLIPESERSPGEGNVIPFQYSCLENSMDRGAYLATVHGLARIGHD